MNITKPESGLAGSGWPAENAIGVPTGTYGVTCLGDGGSAVLTFDSPIYNGPGPDFAVFENGFANAEDTTIYFLELGFVEVSSDGENFFRFPAVTNVPFETQIGTFGCMDPSLIHNFAGKYAAFYGTPFDLDEVDDDPKLNKDSITHVRIVDVIGSIKPEYATFDSEGHIVNDPWPTPFASGGFDLDAVGVIHDLKHLNVDENPVETLTVFPNPAHNTLSVKADNFTSMSVCSMTGQQLLSSESSSIDVTMLPKGLYLVRVVADGTTMVGRFIKD